jgi:4-amino-4-deoxy-L-arabinose transferase-like glycosyltransferase
VEQVLSTAGSQRPSSWVTALAIVTVLLLLVRLWLDSQLELMFDEAYYALWSKNLAWCYLDHPPMVAVWIRVSTWLFGDHEFGIRALGTLAAAAGGALVYLLSSRLFEDRTEAAFAGLLYCSMLLIGAGAIIITPDTPLLFFWSIAIYAVVRIYRDGDWRWWVVVGAAMGLALQSKYSALLLGAGIVSSMVFVPEMRRWWRHPAPYAAGALAFAIFAPVIEWNYEHGWVSFAKQLGRARWHDFSLRYVGEFVGSQIGLLTPFVFALAAGGVWISLRGAPDKSSEPGILLISLIGPMLIYFLFHSLHARVEGNWLAPAYPVLAVLAAHAAFQASALHGRLRSVMMLSRRCALPVGFAFAGIAYLQALTGLLPLDPAKDPTALMAGWSGLAERIDDLARREHAGYVLTSSYGLASLLSIYSPDETPIIQFNERLRWISFQQPHVALFLQPGLYVSETNKDKSGELKDRFSEVKLVGTAVRLRGSKAIKQYVIYRLAQPVSPVLDAEGRDEDGAR